MRSAEPTDWVAIRAVIARDLVAIRRQKAVIIPMLLVPLLMLVALPATIGLAASARRDALDIGEFLSSMPDELARPILDQPVREQAVILIMQYLLAPMFLVVPRMVSAVLASDAFAGEKERHTLESLLHLPISDRDLYLAKLLSAYVPTLAISWGGFVAFTVVANASAWPVMGRLFLPTRLWMVMILWVAPGVAALGLGIMVRVSARANSSQEANQLGGTVILPLVILLVAQTTGLLLAGITAAAIAGAVVWVVAVVLNVQGSRRFTREAVAAKL